MFSGLSGQKLISSSLPSLLPCTSVSITNKRLCTHSSFNTNTHFNKFPCLLFASNTKDIMLRFSFEQSEMDALISHLQYPLVTLLSGVFVQRDGLEVKYNLAVYFLLHA